MFSKGQNWQAINGKISVLYADNQAISFRFSWIEEDRIDFFTLLDQEIFSLEIANNRIIKCQIVPNVFEVHSQQYNQINYFIEAINAKIDFNKLKYILQHKEQKLQLVDGDIWYKNLDHRLFRVENIHTKIKLIKVYLQD